MAEETTTQTPASGEAPAAEAPRGAAVYTDEELASSFPGQDIVHVKSMLDRAAGVGENVVNPYVENEDTNDDTQDEGETAGNDDDAVEYPDWIPEKFRKGTVEEAMHKLADSYTHLERGREGGEGDAAGDAAGDAGDAAGDAAGDDGAASELNLVDVEAEFVKDGKISEATYEAAEKNGMSRDVLDQFIAGQQAIANQLITKVHTMAGGQEEYDAMMKWMIGNMDESEVEAYDAAMGTGKEGTIVMAVRSMKAAYEAAVGTDPQQRIEGDTGKATVQGFQSKREMIDAMHDPRYQKDPAYRAMVAKKIANGNVW